MKDLSQETIEKIKKEHIQPKAKWKFLAKNLLIWSTLLFCMLFGALSFSLVYYLLIGLDWDVIGIGNHLPARAFLGLIPNFWLLMLAISLLVVFFLYRHTKKGYKFGVLPVTLLILLLFLFLGFAAHLLRADRDPDDIFSKNFPGYMHLANNKEKQWSQPEAGLLGGEIIKVEEDNFELEDFQGEDWHVYYDKETLVKPSVELEETNLVKVIGEKKDDSEFHAREIRPWEGKGMMRGKMGGGRNAGNSDR